MFFLPLRHAIIEIRNLVKARGIHRRALMIPPAYISPEGAQGAPVTCSCPGVKQLTSPMQPSILKSGLKQNFAALCCVYHRVC